MTNTIERKDSIRACIERALSPGIGTCYRCCRPWKCPAQRRIGPRTWQQQGYNRLFNLVGVDEHSTPYGPHTRYGQMSGCFPLCERCWSNLTPETRLPYYEALIDKWITMGTSKSDDDLASILVSVKAGL